MQPRIAWRCGRLSARRRRYRSHNCDREITAPTDINRGVVTIIVGQTLKLENEGWERDYDVTEPAEPVFNESA